MADDNHTVTATQNDSKAVQELNAVLEQRIEKLEKTFRLGAIIGAAILVFVIIYMSVLLSGFREAIEPEVLADVVTSEISVQLPEVSKEIEGNLKEMAPDFIASIRAMIIETSVPAIRKMLQDQIASFSKEFVRNSKDTLNEHVYSNMLNYNVDALKAAIEEDGFLDDVAKVAELEKQMVATMDEQLSVEGKNQIAQEMEQSLGALNNITKKLKDLSSKKNLTRKDKLMKRLISAWWTMLDTDKDKVKKEDMEALQQSLSKSTEELFDGTKRMIQEDTKK